MAKTKDQNSKLIMARAAFVAMSPRKLRLIADAIRPLSAKRAVDYLKAMPNASAKPVLQVLQQALGNAKNNFSQSPEGLKIDSLQIEEGPRFKRRDAHAHGARFDSGIRRKRTSHIRVTLTAAK